RFQPRLCCAHLGVPRIDAADWSSPLMGSFHSPNGTTIPVRDRPDGMSNPSDAGWCFRNPQRLTALLLAGKEGVVDRRSSELPAKSIAFGAFTDTASALAAFGATTMRHAFDQLLQFLHQGIAAIFRFVQMIWTWSVDQIATLLAVPWQQWPFWKQVLLVV